MHLAYPKVVQGQFYGCGRYLSCSPEQPPGPAYTQAHLQTETLGILLAATQQLALERHPKPHTTQIYERLDNTSAPSQDNSRWFAYLLASIRCTHPCLLERLAGIGDVWCTGTLAIANGQAMLQPVEQEAFAVELAAFVEQSRDMLMFAPVSQVTPLWNTLPIRVCTLQKLQGMLLEARQSGQWPKKTVVMVDSAELPLLVSLIFLAPQVPATTLPHPTAPTTLENQAIRPSGPPALFESRPNDAEDQIKLASRFVRHYRICVDTGSLLATGAKECLVVGLLPLLKSVDTTLLISDRTLAFLAHPDKADTPISHDSVEQARRIVTILMDEGRLIHAPDPHPLPGHAFDTSVLFPDLFIGFQLHSPLCLITQNAALALQVLKNARSRAFEHVKDVRALYVDSGQLRNWAPRLLGSTLPSQQQSHSGADLTGKIAQDFTIIPDTSSLMLEDADGARPLAHTFFRETLYPLLAINRTALTVPYRVIQELEKHANSGNAQRVRCAQKALDMLHYYRTHGRLVIGQDDHEVAGAHTFADPVFIRLALRFQKDHNLCFITQDRALAQTLLANKTSAGNVVPREFLVTYISRRTAELWNWENRLAHEVVRPAASTAVAPKTPPQALGKVARVAKKPASSSGQPSKGTQHANDNGSRATTETPPVPRQNVASKRNESFAVPHTVSPLDNTLLPLSKLPGEGATVIGTNSGPLQLLEELAAGGEGTIFRTNHDDVVCKIYHQGCLTRTRLAKLTLMVSREVSIPSVCWPLELVYSTAGEFVGYLMPKATGKPLKTAVFARPLLTRQFPHWTREHLTQLALMLLQTIKRLHALNIFIGDINPLNILVTSERQITIVDADSFQIEGYPCPVGTDTFTPPARQGQNFATFLRTPEDELFAVTTLLFMTLFPGKAPYSSQGGGEAAANIRAMRFPYVAQEDGTNITPAGVWQFIWTHLHPAVKQDFRAVFHQGKRISIASLITHLQWSLADMRQGKRSNVLFPTQPHIREGHTVSTHCQECGTEHQIPTHLAEQLHTEGRQFVCTPCREQRTLSRLEATRDVRCARCGKNATVAITHLDNLKANGRAYWCRNCTARDVRCARCGKSATVAVTHLDNLKANGRDYWCRSCTTQARQLRRGARTTQSKCFVATATYQSEKATEVVFLRHYRDNVLRRHGWGHALITFYYRVGPALARLIEQFPVLRPVCRWGLDRLIRYLAKQYPMPMETRNG